MSILRFTFIAAFVLSAWGAAVWGAGPDETSGRYLALVDSASCRLEREQWNMAEHYIKEALRLMPANPGNTMLFSNLGVAQMHQGRYFEAAESLSIALTRAPESTVLLSNRARAWLLAGETERALADLDGLLASSPEDQWGLQSRGLLRLHQGKDLAGARDDFRTLHTRYPDNAWGYCGEGACLEAAGDTAGAEAMYARASGLTADPEIDFRYAMILCRNGKYPEATSLLKESLKRHPEEGNLYLAMSYLHRLQYMNSEAEADLKLAERYGTDPNLIDWLRKTPREMLGR